MLINRSPGKALKSQFWITSTLIWVENGVDYYIFLLQISDSITYLAKINIHNLRKGRLPAEFDSFAALAKLNEENFRSSRFSMFNFSQGQDKEMIYNIPVNTR